MERERALTKNLTEGMKLAEDVLTQDGQLLVAGGTIVTPRLMARLNFYSIPYVYVEPSIKQKPSEKLPKQRNSYFKRVESTYEFKRFNYTLKSGVQVLEESIGSVLNNSKDINVEELIGSVDRMIKETGNGMHLISMLQCIRSYDDLIYVHSVNVSLICNVLADWLHMKKEDKELLTVAALLHDIGKTSIPKEVLSKTEKLTDAEFELIRQHPVLGYNLVKDADLDQRIKLAILQHHERCDGTGYPYGCKSDEMADFSKIISLVDVYDAMTSNRVYREGICPFIVIEILEKEGFQKYDPKFLLPFLEHISQCYINTGVRLSNGCEGEVIMLNRDKLSRPVVKVGNEYVNLAENNYLSIASLL